MSPGKVVRDTNSFGERFQKLFDDPTSYPGNAQDRKAFRRWAGFDAATLTTAEAADNSMVLSVPLIGHCQRTRG
jgi:hypothetical protein